MIQIFHTDGPRLHGLIYAEYLSMLPMDHQETMARSMHNSPDIWVGYNGDKVFAIMGVIPPTLLSDKAYVWFWTTKHFDSSRFLCLRYSRRIVADALLRYPVLVGHCAAGATHSIRWMQWLGATLLPSQGPIIPFRIEAT
jgi:hypothetical protein